MENVTTQDQIRDICKGLKLLHYVSHIRLSDTMSVNHIVLALDQTSARERPSLGVSQTPLLVENGCHLLSIDWMSILVNTMNPSTKRVMNDQPLPVLCPLLNHLWN